MKIAFAGTPDFAARSLAAILASAHQVVLVLTRTDTRAGRGMELRASEVKRLAQAHGLPVCQPATLRDPDERRDLIASGAEVLVVAAYGIILPQEALDIPRLGAINVHASLLPRWRGAAPIQRALLAGDAVTGISIMRMDAGLDTGPVLLSEEITIGHDDTAASLHDRLATLGAELVVRALDGLENGTLRAVPQDAGAATYASKLRKAEARIDWSASAQEIDRRIRAFNPAPGCSSGFGGRELKIWAARVESGVKGRPGEVLEVSPAGLVVGCGEGALRLLELQRPGGRVLPAGLFLQGVPVRAGESFDP